MRLVRMARAHLGALLLTAGALGGLGLGVRLQPESFPVAAIDLRLLAPDAEAAARRELESLSWDLHEYLSAVTFVVDTDARNYLERQLGGPLLNDLAREVPVWYWRVRFFRPLQIEEFEARLHPDGRLLGLYRVVAEAAPGAWLEPEEARRLAELALARAGALAGGVWEQVSASAERRPARMDHVFVWQRTGFEAAEAQHRLRAAIQGDRFDGYAEFVKVPDEWRRAQSRERNRGFVLAQWGWAATSGLSLAAAFVLLRDFRAGAVAWRFPLALGGLLLAVGLAAGLNSLPSTLAGFSTTQTIEGYLLQRAAGTAMEYLPQLGVALLVGAAGVTLYRRALPALLPPEALLSRLRVRHRQVGQGVLAGYAFSGIWLGYLSLFYLVGQRWFGVWNPVEVPYRDVMSSLVPLLFPLTVGVGAAVSEELMFRFFAIPALLLGLPALLGWGTLDRLGRRRRLLVCGLAILLPALVWGSLHANWPQQPFYVRAVEVAGAGVISGLLLVRFGILATLVNHYVSNAAIVAALFLLSGNAYLQVSGVVAVVLPVAVYGLGWVASSVGGRQSAEGAASLTRLPFLCRLLPGLRRGSLPFFLSLSKDRSRGSTSSLRTAFILGGAGPGAWGTSLGLAALAVATFLLLAGPLAVYLLAPRLQVTAGEAEMVALRHLEERGLALRDWRRATTLLDRASSNETLYLARHMGTAAAADLLEREAPLFLWQVRFFRSAVEETAFVWVDHAGHVRGFRHVLPEAAAAPSLAEGPALALAVAAFGVQVPGAVGWQRAGGGSEEREARRDFRFLWERALPAPSAFLRAAVDVSGEALSGLRIFVRVPEEFLRERAARGPLALAWGLARGAALAGLAVLAVALFALRYRRDRLRLREATLGGLAFAGLGLAALLADLPGVLAAYPTTMSLGEYLLWRAAAALQASVLDFVRGALIVGLALSLWREISLTLTDAVQNVRFRIVRALFLMVLAALLLPLLQVAPEALREALGPAHLAPLASWTGAAGEGLPIAAAAVGAARQALELVSLGVVGVALLRSRRRLWPLGLLAVALLLAPEVRDGLDLAQAAVGAGVLVAGAVSGARWLRADPVGYVTVLFGALLLDDALVLLVQPHVLYQVQGAAAAGLALASAAVWPLLGARASRPPGGVPAT